jgi:hypothetical protein
MSEGPVIGVLRRGLREQPVLRQRGMWDPSTPEAGAGGALAAVGAEVQGLQQASAVYVCLGQRTADGLVPGEAVIPVDRLGAPTDDVEAVLLPATDAISAVYRDDIHLSVGKAVVERLRKYAGHEGLSLDGQPRWTYLTSPEWNLELDDHLIEVLWPIR